MKRSIRLAALAAATLLAACAAPQSVSLPAALQPQRGEALAMIVPAKGVQIYECRAGTAGFEWTFVAPDAQLFGRHGQLIGKHGAGPAWEATDGSRVVGTVKAKSPAPVGGAVPWLLLTAKSAGTEGAFSKVTSIQRLHTRGGAAPASGCSGASAGSFARVDYTADYYFFTAR